MALSLHEKIRAIYPSLTDADFYPPVAIMLRDDNDGEGAYIAEWNHPFLKRPTEEDLAAMDS